MYTSDQAVVLKKSPSGENFLLLVFFMRRHGLKTVLCRRSNKGSGGISLPDLFDSGDLTIEEKNASRPVFLKEFIQRKQYTTIAHRYAALEAAAYLARFYELNLVHMESFETAWELLHTALDSLLQKKQSKVVLLKVLYVLSRAEGYPAKEQWIESQPGKKKEILKEIIRKPVDSADCDPQVIDECFTSLERFLSYSTDLIVPA